MKIDATPDAHAEAVAPSEETWQVKFLNTTSGNRWSWTLIGTREDAEARARLACEKHAANGFNVTFTVKA